MPPAQYQELNATSLNVTMDDKFVYQGQVPTLFHNVLHFVGPI